MVRVAALATLVADLERHLGDPRDQAGPVSYARILEHDEREEYPHAPLDHLHAWSAQEYAVPVSAGGRAVDIQDSLALMAQVARRDATLATALSITSLSYMPVWVAGTVEQKRFYADAVRNGAKMCWGLSERDHGSDIIANSMYGRPTEGGFLVSGEKWLVGNASLADYLVLHVRTADKGGPAGFSILILPRRSVTARQLRTLPNERLHGLRALDMSGFRLDECFVPDSAVVGGVGRGVEVTLKSSHAVRVVISSLAIGCADTALRTTLDFATRRQIFGRHVVDIPYSRRQLVEAFADLLMADVVATCSARSLQTSPAQSSVFSAVTKYFVPTALDRTVTDLAVVLGARHYLRQGSDYAMFQKAKQDLLVANFADGNTVVNLKNVALQLDTLVEVALRQPADAVACAERRARTLFDWDAELPEYHPWEAEPFGRGRDDALLALPASIAMLRTLADTAACGGQDGDADLFARCAEAGEGFQAELRRLAEKLADLKAGMGREYGQSAGLFRLAEQFCVLHAEATCLGFAVHSAGWRDAPLAGPASILLVLERLWRWLYPLDYLTDRAVVDELAAGLKILHERHRSFGYRQLPLAEGLCTGVPDLEEAV
jgi:alkylation response protein AidB-like acyl-CoA dehydrogenase